MNNIRCMMKEKYAPATANEQSVHPTPWTTPAEYLSPVLFESEVV